MNTPLSNARWLGMALCGGAMVTVGSTVVASRLIASGLLPFTATALRFAVAAPVLWCLMRLTGTAWPRPDRRDGALLLAQAVAGSVGYTVLLILGTRHAPAADAGVVAGTLPAVAALFAVLALGERPTRALLLSTALATLGVLAISLPEARSAVRGAGSGALLGHALVLGAVVCEATFILINKRLRVPVPPLALSATMSVLGLLTCAVPALMEQPWLRPVPATAVGAVVCVLRAGAGRAGLLALVRGLVARERRRGFADDGADAGIGIGTGRYGAWRAHHARADRRLCAGAGRGGAGGAAVKSMHCASA